MKKVIIILIIALNITSAFCQTKISKEARLKAQIIALEKAGWEAWKNKNVAWFRNNTTEGCLWINSEGINNKAQMNKSTQTDCNVKVFLLIVLNL